MGLFEKKKRQPPQVQLVRDTTGHPFGMMDRYVPLHSGETALYRSIREAVPILDAAVSKLVRLVGGVSAEATNPKAQWALDEFLRTVDIGRGQRGIHGFLDLYLDSMFVCGRAVGEIVPVAGGRDIGAILCGNVADVELREGENQLHFDVCVREGGRVQPLPHQELLLFTPFQPETDSPYGVSLFRSMPFMTEVLLKIFQATGQNWERMGNIRYAVKYKPERDSLSGNLARERGEQIASEWSRAMQESRDGRVRDFVAVGDVEICAIGADNLSLDSEVPVRQILEQLVAKTGIPPFLLGLSWSSTERMSVQQADLMSSEIFAIRRSVEPVIERICEMFLALRGYGGSVRVGWEDVHLKDMVEEARARLLNAQAAALEAEQAAYSAEGSGKE